MSDKLMAKAFRRFIDTTEDSFLLVDKKGRIVEINEHYYQALTLSKAMPREQLIGMPVDEILSNSILSDFIEQSEPAQVNLDFFFTGPEFNVNLSSNEVAVRTCANIFDETGAVIGAFADVKTYAQIREMCEAVVGANRAFQLRDFLSSPSSPDCYDDIIGHSRAIARTKDIMLSASKSDFNVIITGESGTGKELFAQAIHKNSARRDKPFVALNCSAIPSELFESEMFGYEEGAFTGARKGGNPGKFEQADGGTLFLDEIADIPISQQVKLLRVIQESEISRLGSNNTKKLDVRIIVATNKDLYKCVREKKFRADLYYRLNVLTINIPPLRERREDIALLANYFLQELNQKYDTNAFLSASALSEMELYDWPGNVRELQNMIERMYVFRSDSVLRSTGFHTAQDNIPASGHEEFNPALTLQEQVDNFERSLLVNHLAKNRYNIKKTAELLGLNRTTLYNKIKKYNIPLSKENDTTFV